MASPQEETQVVEGFRYRSNRYGSVPEIIDLRKGSWALSQCGGARYASGPIMLLEQSLRLERYAKIIANDAPPPPILGNSDVYHHDDAHVRRGSRYILENFKSARNLHEVKDIESSGNFVGAISGTSEFRSLIIVKKTAGWSTRRVAGQVDRSECAVRNCWEQWTREGTHAPKTRSGATKKTTRREDRRIVRQALVDPTVTRSTIRAAVGVTIVPQTISRHLAEANLKSKRPFRVLPSNTGTSANVSTVVPSQINVECHRLAKGCV
ncbi:transposable element Tcb1 transposase [Trichonephila clavipes]|nr:transposable element Tcb1 transposase [Trichonephila clavipes]